MATLSVLEPQPSEQRANARARHWEEECYPLGCALAWLHAQRSATWQDKRWAARTMVTRY